LNKKRIARCGVALKTIFKLGWRDGLGRSGQIAFKRHLTGNFSAGGNKAV